MSLTFYATGDVELWHTRVGAWQVPMYCQPILADGVHKAWHVWKAIHVNPFVMAKLSNELDSDSTWQSTQGWVLMDGVFRAGFRKAEGVTPSYYLRREGVQVNPREAEIEVMTESFNQDTKPPAPRASFVEDLVAKTDVASPALVKAIYNAICNHMAQWLLIEGKSIDFGWFQVHAFPVRANWKQILLARHPDLVDASIEKDSEVQSEIVQESGALGSLQETTLVSLRGDGGEKRVGWTIEVEPSEAWDQYCDAMELHRLQNSHGNTYVSWWGAQWYRMRKSAIGCLLRFASQCRIPAATLGEGGSRSRSGFVEYIPKGSVRSADVDDIAVRVVSTDSASTVRLPDGREAGILKTGSMPKMPNLRLQVANLRDARKRRPNG